jgi:hypothetical protein
MHGWLRVWIKIDKCYYVNDSAINIPHYRNNTHFIGQVYEYTDTGEEYPKFDY